MPRIMMSSLTGDVVQITSSDPSTVGSWLMEWLPQMCPGTPAMPSVRLDIYAWSTPDGKGGWVPDWPDERTIDEPWTPAEVQRVAEVLRAIAAERERKKVKG